MKDFASTGPGNDDVVTNYTSSNVSPFPVRARGERRIDASAAAAIALLDKGRGALSEVTAAEMRRRYSQSRSRVIAPKPPIGARETITPSRGGVPSLTLFRPEKHTGLLPAMIFFHGGGWCLGGLDTYEPVCRELANQTGAAIIWVEYRMAPESPFPAAIEDAWAAAEWVQANAERLGVDPRKIGLAGDSAGGNLAAVTAIAARDGYVRFDPAFQVLIYPCLDLTASAPSHDEFAKGYLLTKELYAWYRRNYVGHLAEHSDWRISPLFAASLADLPYTVLLYAGFDPLRDEAVQFAKRLDRENVAFDTIYFPGQIHGFVGMGGIVPEAKTAIEETARMVRRHLDTLRLRRV